MSASTASIRIHTQAIADARHLTGLDAGPAVRKLLDEGIAARKQPVTLKDHAEAAIGHIRRLVEEAK